MYIYIQRQYTHIWRAGVYKESQIVILLAAGTGGHVHPWCTSGGDVLLQQEEFGALGFRAWCWLCWRVRFRDAMDRFRFSHVGGHVSTRTEHVDIYQRCES